MKTKAYDLFRQGNITEAQKICEILSHKTPDDAQIWHLLGLIYAKTQHFKGAKTALLNALELETTVHTLISLGQLSLVTNMLEDAEAYFSQALEIDLSNTDVHTGLACVYGVTDKLDLSINHYQQVINLGAANADTYGNMAELYFRLRKEDKAKEAAQMSVNIDSDNIAGNLLLSQIERNQGKFSSSIGRLNSLLKQHTHPSVIVRVATGLGLTLDKNAQYAEAYKSFETANEATQVIIDSLGYKKDTYFDYIDLCKKWFPLHKNHDDHKSLNYKSTEDMVFFVGFPRSGTTLVEQILTSSPKIETTSELPLITDLISFTKDTFSNKGNYPELLKHLNDSDIQLIREEYFKNLLSSIGSKSEGITYIDKLPLNLIELGFINYIFPDAKVIMVYRDPRDVCLSCFMQNFKLNPAMSHFTSLKEAAGLYSKTMDLWLHYKKNLDLDLYEYKYEELVEDTELISRELAQFIGQQWTSEMDEYYKHAASKKINTPSYIDVTSPIYTRSINRWKNYSTQIEGIENNLQPYLKQFGYE